MVPLLLLAASTALGAPPPDPAPRATVEDTVVVVATRSPRRATDTPGHVSVVTAQEIEQRLRLEFADVVRGLPGVELSSSAVREGLGGLSLRGVGGNRVLAFVDGMPVAEEFTFGHFEVPRVYPEVDTIESVEILRGAASALYGSDALGGVVSIRTLSSRAIAGGDGLGLSLRTTWDGRDEGLGVTALVAGTARRPIEWSLQAVGRRGHETSTRGTVATADPSRTAADPADHDRLAALGKVVIDGRGETLSRLVIEAGASTRNTDLLSTQGTVDLGAIFGFPPGVVYTVDKSEATARDESDRFRLGIWQGLTPPRWIDGLDWSLSASRTGAEQATRELRATTTGGGPFGPSSTREIERTGLLTFDQETFSGELVARHHLRLRQNDHLVTFGLSLGRDRFDQIRDRIELDTASATPVASADGLTYPTKYFPASVVDEIGVFAQGELSVAGGRVTVIPGIRWDGVRVDADQNDPIYLSGNAGTELPVDLEDDALTPKLGIVVALPGELTLTGQYARGFRAPPFASVNSGFTHLAGGVTRLPNPDLRPETSDLVELGLARTGRTGSWSLHAFRSELDDFIELTPLGLNPSTGLVELQPRNVARARVEGLELSARFSLGQWADLELAATAMSGRDLELDLPLLSVPPTEWIAILGRAWAAGRGRADLTIRHREAPSPTERDQFEPPASTVVDLSTSFDWRSGLALQVAVLNLLDETSWSWPEVIGQPADAPTIDRLSEPGRAVLVGIRYRHRSAP